MTVLERFGTPAYLIVPSDLHRMDVKIWKDRYPEMTVVAPAAVRAKVEKIVPVDATSVDFGDPAVRFVTVPGTGGQVRDVGDANRALVPFAGPEWRSVRHTGHASEGSSTRRLRASFLVIVHLFVKGDNQAIGAEQELEVQRLAGNPR